MTSKNTNRITEIEVEKATIWVENNDINQDVLDRFSVAYSYVFKDEEILMTDEEESYVFFIWSVALHVISSKLNQESDSTTLDLETEENALWEILEVENQKASTADLLFANCDEEELFALIEDAIAYDSSDPEFPLPSKELAELIFVKMTAVVNILSRQIV